MTRGPRSRAHRFFIVFSALATLLVGYYIGNLYVLRVLRESISATLFDPAREIQPFQLVDQNGALFDEARLRGHWSLVYRGCLSCSDGQRPVLSLLAQVYNRLADQPRMQETTHFVVLSSNPQQDTPQRLNAILRSFPAQFLGLSGEPETLATLAGELRLVASTTALQPPAGALGESPLLIVDPRGKVFGAFGGWLDAATIAQDLKQIRDRMDP